MIKIIVTYILLQENLLKQSVSKFFQVVYFNRFWILRANKLNSRKSEIKLIIKIIMKKVNSNKSLECDIISLAFFSTVWHRGKTNDFIRRRMTKTRFSSHQSQETNAPIIFLQSESSTVILDVFSNIIVLLQFILINCLGNMSVPTIYITIHQV